MILPLAIRPTGAAAPLIAASTFIARFRAGPSAAVVTISASVAGAISAPPMLWAARAASNYAWEVAKPPATEAAENRLGPAANTRRRPSRFPGPAVEEQQPAEAKRMSVHHPLQAAPGKPERALDVR